MSYVNPLIKKWKSGQPTLGAWLTQPDPSLAEYMAACGFDEVCADQQHSTIDVNDLAAMFMAIETRGSVATTRVGFNDPFLIGKSLDLGAQMVIIPMVNNAAEAARAVRAFHYSNAGVRSAGPVRPQYTMGDRPSDLEKAAWVVMVETKAGLANVDEIAATPGVDAIYIGPGDLALGLDMDWDSSAWTASQKRTHAEAVETIRKACERHGVTPGIHVGNAAQSARYVEQGFRLLTIASDMGLIAAGRTSIDIVRKAVPPGRKGGGKSGGRAGKGRSPKTPI